LDDKSFSGVSVFTLSPWNVEYSLIKSFRMGRKINVTITKENIYDVEKLINEINNYPKTAFNFCLFHGIDGFTF